MEIPSNEVLLAELKANKVLKTLSEKEFAALAKSVRFIPYKKGETIFKQGNRVNDISILMRGLTKTCIENRSHERNTIVSLQLPIDLLGYSTVFDETYQATAVALCADFRRPVWCHFPRCRQCVADAEGRKSSGWTAQVEGLCQEHSSEYRFGDTVRFGLSGCPSRFGDSFARPLRHGQERILQYSEV